MMALNTYAESKLVVYGPQELIDNFNAKDEKADDKSPIKNKSKWHWKSIQSTNQIICLH